MRNHRLGSFAMGSGLAMLIAGIAQGQTTYTYSTFTVPEAAPATANSLQVFGIDKNGDVSGSIIDTSGNTKGFVRSAAGTIGVFADPLDTATPIYSPAYGIDDYGYVVGTFQDTAAGNQPGYVLSLTKKTFTTINLPDEPTGTDVIVYSINDIGSYCGVFGVPPDYVPQSFLVTKGTLTVVTLPTNTNSSCTGINDANVAAGTYTDTTGVNHGWYRDPSNGNIFIYSIASASTVPGNVPCVGTSIGGTVFDGINDKEAISGHFYDTNNMSHGFVISGKTFTQLDVPGAYETGGGGINVNGQVTGHFSDSSCNNSGFIATPSSSATAVH